ncbi:MAG TPA: carboxypeptidase-like regulatory domain-containing protein [Isosphaeraceae bacterium]|nr:carboxypeptidase-like regulatory domain-containing protein [Isosphaeraceae bacterium]
MRSLLSRSLLVAVTVLPALASDAHAYQGRNWYETVYVSPTESILTVPTSYAVPSAYVLPTSYSYVLPTSYSYVWPTSYVAPTVYSSTSYVPTYYLSSSAYVVPSSYVATSYTIPARRLFRRPLIATSRSYTYYPTTWNYPLVTTSAVYPTSDCEAAPPPAIPRAAAPGTNGKSAPNEGNTERQSGLDSVPRNEPVLSNEAGNLPTGETVSPPPVSTEPPPPSGANPPPPAAPAPAEDAAPTGGGAATPNPATPGGSTNLLPNDTPRRLAQRPKLTAAGADGLIPTRGILEGKVVSAESGQIEEGVRIVVTDRMKRFTDRVATSDAFGHYAITLPEGDWEVRVTMPSRKTFGVSRITVSGGQITDENERTVASLLIKR